MINLEFKLNQKGGTLFFVKLQNQHIEVNLPLNSTARQVKDHLRHHGHNIDNLEITVGGITKIIPDDDMLHIYGLKKEGFLNGIITIIDPIDKRLIDATFNGKIDDIVNILNEVEEEESISLIINIRSLDDHNKTLIHYASRKGYYEILYLLKSKIGDINFRSLVNILDNENRSPLMMACRGSLLHNEDSLINTITLLLDNMNDEQKNATDINGNSALKFAINSSVSNNLASIIYSSVNPTLHDFVSQFYDIGRGIDMLIDQYSPSKSFLLDKYMTVFVKINWELLKQRVKEI